MGPRKTKGQNSTPSPIADAVKRRREAFGWTQGQLADEAGVSQKMISEIERGDQDLMTVGLGRVLEIVKALNWSLFDLQEAAGVSLGMESPGQILTPAPLRTFNLYPISEATKWPGGMQDFAEWPAHVWNKHQRPGLAVFFEGDHPELGGILHYIDTHDRNPESENYYLVVTDGKAVICEYKATGGIGIFLHPTAGIFNPKDVTVIGHRYMQTTMRPSPTGRTTH